MQMTIHRFDLKLKHEFKIAHDSRKVQKTLIVELSDGKFSGFGETMASNYYKIDLDALEQELEENRQFIESYDYSPPEQYWIGLDARMTTSFATAAIDVAVNDLYAKKQNKTLRSLWGYGYGPGPLSSYTIGIDSVDKMVEKVREFPWPTYKIKLGTNDDLRIVRELRKVTSSMFRVDANCGWEVDQAVFNSGKMEELGVEFIEQPLKHDDWDGMRFLHQKSNLPHIADESCAGIDDVQKCHGYFDGINIKLVKCGGLTPARKMIQQARSLKLKVMAGCMTESSVGISAVAQLLPALDYADMDGPLLIQNDIARGLNFHRGIVTPPPGAGIGITEINVASEQ